MKLKIMMIMAIIVMMMPFVLADPIDDLREYWKLDSYTIDGANAFMDNSVESTVSLWVYQDPSLVPHVLEGGIADDYFSCYPTGCLIRNETTTDPYVSAYGNSWNQMTVCLWANTSQSTDGTFFDSTQYGSNDNYVVSFGMYTGGYPYIWSRNFDTEFKVRSDVSINDGDWHFICFRGGNTLNHYAFTVDGVNTSRTIISGSDNGRVFGQVSNRDSVHWGYHLRGSASQKYFVGQMDEMGVWNRSLSDSEIQFLYRSGKGLTYPFELVLLVGWDEFEKANNSYTNDEPIVFNYEVEGVNSSTDCDFYTNLTGSFTINQSDTGLVDGNYQFNLTTYAGQLEDVEAYIECTEGAQSNTTSIKIVHIDMVNVLMYDYYPVNSTQVKENESVFNLNLSASNVNLDYTSYRILYPDNTTFQENEADIDQKTYDWSDEVNLTGEPFGVYTIEFYANDSATNDNNITITFEYLDTQVSLDWDSQEPTNDSSHVDAESIRFYYTLDIENIDSVTCGFYENDNLYDSQVQSSDGVYGFTRDYGLNYESLNDYYITCENGVFTNTTSTKVIYVNNTYTPVQDLIVEGGTGMAVFIDRLSVPTGKFLLTIVIVLSLGLVLSGIVVSITGAINKIRGK